MQGNLTPHFLVLSYQVARYRQGLDSANPSGTRFCRIGLPVGVQVGSCVSEVRAAFVTTSKGGFSEGQYRLTLPLPVSVPVATQSNLLLSLRWSLISRFTQGQSLFASWFIALYLHSDLLNQLPNYVLPRETFDAVGNGKRSGRTFLVIRLIPVI